MPIIKLLHDRLTEFLGLLKLRDRRIERCAFDFDRVQLSHEIFLLLLDSLEQIPLDGDIPLNVRNRFVGRVNDAGRLFDFRLRCFHRLVHVLQVEFERLLARLQIVDLFEQARLLIGELLQPLPFPFETIL